MLLGLVSSIFFSFMLACVYDFWFYNFSTCSHTFFRGFCRKMHTIVAARLVATLAARFDAGFHIARSPVDSVFPCYIAVERIFILTCFLLLAVPLDLKQLRLHFVDEVSDISHTGKIVETRVVPWKGDSITPEALKDLFVFDVFDARIYIKTTENGAYVSFEEDVVKPEKIHIEDQTATFQIVSKESPSPRSSPEVSQESTSEDIFSNEDDVSAGLKDAFSKLSTKFSFQSGIPHTYVDTCMEELETALKRPLTEGDENWKYLILAVPGAGKTRTVKEAATRAGIQYKRIKLSEDDVLISSLRLASKSEENMQNVATDTEDTYASAKAIFKPIIGDFLSKGIKEWFPDLQQQRCVHFDEVQVLMGRNTVSSKSVFSKNLFDYIMPALGDALEHKSTSRIRFVLTGTNAYSNIVLTSGSALKKLQLRLSGSFPRAFVQSLLSSNFSIADDTEQAGFDTVIDQILANRRVVQYTFHAL